MVISEILDKWMEERKVVLLDKYESSGRKASGMFGSSIAITTTENNSKMTGSKHVWYMVNGRNPTSSGKRMPVSVIQQWIDDKGLDLNAWAVARHIDKFGIKVPNANNDGRLLKHTFTPESIKQLGKELSRNFIMDIKSNIQKVWQQ